MKKENVFVYGSLKRGYWNHVLLEDSDFVRYAQTEPKFQLYHNGHYPMMIEGALSVYGEVYKVTPDVLALLDRLEGVPHHYRREKILLDDGSKVWAYIYNCQIADYLKPCGDFWEGERRR